MWARERQPEEVAYGLALGHERFTPSELREQAIAAERVAARGREVSDTKFKAMGFLSADPDKHVRKIKAMQQLGATAIVIMNIAGHDPLGMIDAYGEHVLPALRGG